MMMMMMMHLSILRRVESLYLHLFMFHEFSLTCHDLSPNWPVLVTFGFSRALGFGSGIFSLQAVGHDEALQAFIFDQRGDVVFFWEIPPGRGWTWLRKSSTRRHKKDHRNMYFTYKQQEFNRNLEGSKGVCRALSRVTRMWKGSWMRPSAPEGDASALLS